MAAASSVDHSTLNDPGTIVQLARFERIENEHRDRELIIFRLLNIQSEDWTDTISRVAAFLGSSLTSTEIADAF